MPGSSFVEPGITPLLPTPLVWATSPPAVDDAGMSRRYGGIHFPDADLNGRTLGRSVGAERLGEGADVLRRQRRLSVLRALQRRPGPECQSTMSRAMASR